MRARAGDPPRTMPQKILAGRANDPSLGGALVDIRVDQVVLAREPAPALHELLRRQIKKVGVEIALAYDGHCITSEHAFGAARPPLPREVVQSNMLLARPGIGFPAAVHLERFAAPARLALTDDPRLASLGGAGLLTLVASPSQLLDVLTHGVARMRPVRSVQVLFSGKLRPFVSVRDVGLELLRDGLADRVRRVDQEHGAPVVLEFAGQSSRLLSVPERALLCSLAPQVGAAGAVFVSDEKTEVYLRDQRRSKAHRGLQPDPGAPCDDVITLDLGAVDPLILDGNGEVRTVRELEGEQVGQVLMGGDCGASLKELLSTAALLKSKRIPSTLEFLVAPPSRQAFEVLASDGALVDLLATGARLLEPDVRVLSGELYPPPGDGVLSMRTFDGTVSTGDSERVVIASADTVAAAIAHGEVVDPRAFKRPVRVTVPRSLPTDDALIVRKQKGKKIAATIIGDSQQRLERLPWNGPSELCVSTNGCTPKEPTAMVCADLKQVRWAALHAGEFAPQLRAVAAEYMPAAYVSMFSGLGILALTAEQEVIHRLRAAKRLRVSAVAKNSDTIEVHAESDSVHLRWLAVDSEREWALHGSVESGPGQRPVQS